MMTIQRPMRTTIIFGLVCGLFFIPVNLTFDTLLRGWVWPVPSFRLSIWCCLALYGVMLTNWGGKRISGTLFPLALLMISVPIIPSDRAFLLIVLAILSWLRSGLSFPGPLFRTAGAELTLSFGGGFLVAGFSPHSLFTWALGIWLFFLIQSLYFMAWTESGNSRFKAREREQDPFEAARKEAEKILSGRS